MKSSLAGLLLAFGLVPHAEAAKVQKGSINNHQSGKGNARKSTLSITVKELMDEHLLDTQLIRPNDADILPFLQDNVGKPVVIHHNDVTKHESHNGINRERWVNPLASLNYGTRTNRVSNGTIHTLITDLGYIPYRITDSKGNNIVFADKWILEGLEGKVTPVAAYEYVKEKDPVTNEEKLVEKQVWPKVYKQTIIDSKAPR